MSTTHESIAKSLADLLEKMTCVVEKLDQLDKATRLSVEKETYTIEEPIAPLEKRLEELAGMRQANYLSIKGAARLSGLSESFIRRKVKIGELPSSKKGDRYCIARDDLDTWMQQDKGRASAPPQLPTVRRRGAKDHYSDF